MFRPTLIAAAVALTAGLVAGCGGDPEPKFAQSSDPTTPSSAVSASAKPETAEQFLRQWHKVSDMAQTSGDVRTFNSLNDPHCESCSAFVGNVKRIYGGGGVVKSGGTRILWIHETATENEYRVRTLSPPARYRESARGPWKSLTGGSVTGDFELARHAGKWLVVDYSQIAGSFTPLPGEHR